ncbi:MAG: hypothetical protein ACT443_06180 [Gemmatimonadota bacterium]
MKRSMMLLQLLALAGLAVAAPRSGYAAKCTDQWMVCLNDATEYSGAAFQFAEAECGLEYTGCLASKLKFW